MGRGLFSAFPAETRLASDILGYDIEELCTQDPRRQLVQTQFTQPALYVVNAFHYQKQYAGAPPGFLAGHSLGEYNALLAAGAFDFETGLRLVQKRGELMAAASGGGMAAVIGLSAGELQSLLREGGHDDIDLANFNAPGQIVIAGKKESIEKVVEGFKAKDITIMPLAVSAPFHSRYMKPAAEAFAGFLKDFSFNPLRIPVIANATARPYEEGAVAELLSTQIASSVRWVDSIRFLMGRGVEDYEEVGGSILSRMVKDIRAKCTPIVEEKVVLQAPVEHKPKVTLKAEPPSANIKYPSQERVPAARPKPVAEPNGTLATRLGSAAFREDHSVKYAYIAGAMYRGIASKELVARMGRAKMIGYLGTGGMSLNEIEDNIKYIQSQLTQGEAYGMNLLHHLTDPAFEMKSVELYLKYGIQRIEAAAYMQMTESLVYYRLRGLRRGAGGEVVCDNKILAKVSRPEVAQAFMSPAPEKIIQKLLDKELVSQEQAELSKLAPMSHDICVEADSGGHTDGGVALVLLPAIQSLRKDIQAQYNYARPIRVGLAGGIGTPQSAACAFVMGADFILTGSINQCTVEAGMSDEVKTMLQDINVQDTAYAPAGDMFEIGAKVQVLRKGVLFPARANKLYNLYQQYGSLEEIPEKTIRQIEKNYFKQSIADIWEQTRAYFTNRGEPEEIEKAEQNPRHKMALVFRWYFGYSSRAALAGDMEHKVNFQVHTGPALGAFNQWVKGTELERWQNRHADQIGARIMEEAALLLENTLKAIGKE